MGLGKVKGAINQFCELLDEAPEEWCRGPAGTPVTWNVRASRGRRCAESSARINVQIGSVTQAHGWKAPKPHVYEWCAGTTAMESKQSRCAGPSHTSAKVSTIKAAVFLGQIRVVAGLTTSY